jgi:tetratricopeptide (TPR) repeat protein
MRAFRLAAIFVVATAGAAFAGDPWDAPVFSADPAALIAAAEKVPAGDSAIVVLLDEGHFSFESDGRTHNMWRHMMRVVGESAIDDAGTLAVPWAPWYHERPVIAARIVAKDGTVHTLDPKAVTEAPDFDSEDIFSDNRLLRAPLPGVAVGSIIEYTITYDGKNPVADAGTADIFAFGSDVPTERTRLTIDGPASMQPKIVNTTTVQPQSSERDGRRFLVFESGRIEGRDDDEGYLPFDTMNGPYVAFSTGGSWQTLARRYGEIVDKQIAGNDLAKFVRDAVGTATDRNEIVARALAAIEKNVRYAGVEVGESSIVPRSPRTVLGNKYGDCKDKATLLVAMLRHLGIPAHVALLRSGIDFDVIPDLPGLGRFNHAIVLVEGESPMWVDPTDEFARAGELPSEDQGRLALVASETTTALLRTPETPSASNRYAETRVYTLPEEGKARLAEITETLHGAEDAYQRRYYAGSDRTEYREQMENYVKSYYLAKKLEKIDASDPHDLSKPFRVTIEAAETDTGVVHNGDGGVAFHPSNLVQWLPYELRESDEERAKNADSKKRTRDFVFPAPGVHEWTFRLIPPAGYSARTLPQNETTKLGTTALTREFAAQADGSVTAVLRFDSGKRRITAAEFEETRVAISKMLEEKSTLVGFDLIGQAKLNAGDVAGALAEFRKLAEIHPKESQHHIEIGRALLTGGLGEPARAEIRRAVALEPKNARAHLALGGILEYDLLGRLLRKGFDMPGALAALRTAKQLDPKNREIRDGLCKLLTYGSDGLEFSRDARIDEAIVEYRAAMKELDEKDAKGFDSELMTALAFARRFAEMKELAKTMEVSAERETGRIVAVAATDGAQAALKELGAFEPNTRRTYASTVGQTLVKLRLYPQSAEILESAIQGAPNASSARPFIEALRKAKRLEDVVLDANDPKHIVKDSIFAVTRHDAAAIKALMASDLLHESEKDEDPLSSSRLLRVPRELPPEVYGDLTWSTSRIQIDGDDKSGLRLRVRSESTGAITMILFVTRENGRYVVRAVQNASEMIGHAALRFADAGDLESARIWLNWLREELSAGGGDDPLRGVPFASLWQKEKPAATADEIRVAAASLIVRRGNDKSLAILTAAREKASADAAKWIDSAMAVIASVRKEWTTVASIGERLYNDHPDSDSAFAGYASGLINGGRTDEAIAVARKRLEKKPKDVAAMRVLSGSAAQAHDYASAAKYAAQIVDELTPAEADYNNAAWFALFTGNLDQALENARRATSDEKTSTAASLHTLATLYAETGKNIEARDALLRTLDRSNRDLPESSDWYVLGRMAENYGVRDAALAAYKRVEPKPGDGASVWELAQKRLAVLAAKP